MRIRIGLENNMDGRSIAWALDFPGCYADGMDGSLALVSLPQALVQYEDWVNKHASPSWLPDLSEFDVRLVETWQGYCIDDDLNESSDGYEVNAWFRDDWRALTETEIDHGLQMLRWSRVDLLATLAGASQAALEEKLPGERWSVLGVLKHVAGAEWWYLDRLDLAGMTGEQLPKDPFERLPLVRSRLEAVLPGLAGVQRVLGKEGEFWSPRKILRRALWHERDHIGHIEKLLGKRAV
jgi:hypothetical protein